MGKGGGGGGDGQQTTTTVQKADPWGGLQPYLTGSPGVGGVGGLEGLYPASGRWFESGTPEYYPGSTIASQSPETLASLNLRSDLALTNPVTSAAMGEGARTIGGEYLGANPYLDQMYGKAAGELGRQYQDIVNPTIAARFGMGGRTGSGAEQAAYGQAQHELGGALGNLATDIYGQNYNQERQRQMQGLLFAPQLQTMPYTDIGQLAGVGAEREAFTQQNINDLINRWNFEQQQPLEKLQAYNQLLQGGSVYGTQTGTQTQPLYRNKTAGALGGAATGAGIGSMFGPVGMGIGAIGGGLLGAFG